MQTTGIKGDLFAGQRRKMEVIAVLGGKDDEDELSDDLDSVPGENADRSSGSPRTAEGSQPAKAGEVALAVPPLESVSIDEPIPYTISKRRRA